VRNAVEGPDLFNFSSKPISSQIFPVWIIAFDERILFGASPTLELFFPRDGIANVTKVRVIHENDTMVVSREARNLAAPMLSNTHEQIVRYSDVERGARFVAHHVDPVIVIFR
jgi:hypothetical protein